MKKKIAVIAIAMLLPVWLLAQNPLWVKVKDENGRALSGASVKVGGTVLSGQTNAQGEFRLSGLNEGDYVLEVSFLGFRTERQKVRIPGKGAIEVLLSAESFLTDEVIVQATRATANSATTYKNLSKEDLAKNNMGQEVPYLLNQTPSVIVSSDAGNGIGHTAFLFAAAMLSVQT